MTAGISWPEATIILSAIGAAFGILHRFMPEKAKKEAKKLSDDTGGVNVPELHKRVIVLEVKDMKTQEQLTRLEDKMEGGLVRVHERIDQAQATILEAISRHQGGR